MSLRVIRVGILQMAVRVSKEASVEHAVSMIKQAKSEGAHMVVLPECFNSPYGPRFFPQYCEPVPSGPTCQALSRAAKENSILVVGGSIPEVDGNSLFNTSTVWNPSGELVAKHRKVHLFDINIPGGIKFMESDSLKAGSSLTSFTFGPWNIGLGVCYDVRFHEMASCYRKLGANLLIYPGAFNLTTGPLHWELLLRARAVDNQCFVVGCSPARDVEAEYVAWGHSMAIDPWGKVLTCAEDSEKLSLVDIDLDSCEKVRSQIPIGHQRRPDVYDTVIKNKH